MVIIRGKVDPERTTKSAGMLGALFGAGRWDIEYTAKDRFGTIVDNGRCKTRPDGCFAVAVNVRAHGVVEVKVKGKNGCNRDDGCTVAVFSDDDIINLPRRLSPE